MGERLTSGGSLRSNFVERDPDQIVMRLRGFGSGNPEVEVFAGTFHGADTFPRLQNLHNPSQQLPHLVNADAVALKDVWAEYDNPAHALSLEQRPANSGVFHTEPQLLVSDPEDDDRPKNGIFGPNDNFEDDPTRLIALGGFLEAIPVINGSVQPVFSAEVEPAATVTVNVVVFDEDIGADPVRSLDDVADEWKAVAERFAQAGVKIDCTIRYGVDPPFPLPTGDDFLTAAEKITVPPHDIEIATPTAEMRQLILDTPLPGADYNVFYVTQMRAGLGDQPNVPAKGVAYFSGGGNGWGHPNNEPFWDNAFVSSEGQSEATLMTAAHELGHLLTNAGHFGGEQSLMTDETAISDDRSVTGTKRLDAGRQEDMNQNLGITP